MCKRYISWNRIKVLLSAPSCTCGSGMASICPTNNSLICLQWPLNKNPNMSVWLPPRQSYPITYFILCKKKLWHALVRTICCHCIHKTTHKHERADYVVSCKNMLKYAQLCQAPFPSQTHIHTNPYSLTNALIRHPSLLFRPQWRWAGSAAGRVHNRTGTQSDSRLPLSKVIILIYTIRIWLMLSLHSEQKRTQWMYYKRSGPY